MAGGGNGDKGTSLAGHEQGSIRWEKESNVGEGTVIRPRGCLCSHRPGNGSLLSQKPSERVSGEPCGQ